MAIRGKQDFWVVGARVLFRRSGATDDSILDLGTIKSLTPNFDVEKVTLEDPDGGVKTTVFEIVSKFTEGYEFTCANFNQDNLALIFNAGEVEAWSQAAAGPIGVNHTVKSGKFHKVKDASGVFLYNLGEIVLTDTSYAITAVNTGTKTFTIAGDHETEFDIAGRKVRIGGNAGGVLTSKSYTIVSATFNTPNTDIVVSEVVHASTTASGRIGLEYEATDYEVSDLKRGLFEILADGSIVDDTVVEVFYVTAVTTEGGRLLYPQSAGGTVEGTMIVIFGRDGNASQTFRECTVALSSTGLNLTADDASDFTLSATVLSDRTTPSTPAGRLLQAVGDVPA